MGQILDRTATRGSRRHVLDWVERPTFPDELSRLLQPLSVSISRDKHVWMPESWSDATEARLTGFLMRTGQGEHTPELIAWWLRHPRGANTPNWDLISTAEIGGRAGLVLVEAKAHHNELHSGGKMVVVRDGKQLDRASEQRSEANHAQIAAAITSARQALEARGVSTGISVDACYQLSNRVAHAWWLASRGIPVVLCYLGFADDQVMRDGGPSIDGPEQWRRVFFEHAHGVLSDDITERWIDCGPASFCIAVRCMAMPRGYDPGEFARPTKPLQA